MLPSYKGHMSSNEGIQTYLNQQEQNQTKFWQKGKGIEER
jgi:hypothetical protein